MYPPLRLVGTARTAASPNASTAIANLTIGYPALAELFVTDLSSGEFRHRVSSFGSRLGHTGFRNFADRADVLDEPHDAVFLE